MLLPRGTAAVRPHAAHRRSIAPELSFVCYAALSGVNPVACVILNNESMAKKHHEIPTALGIYSTAPVRPTHAILLKSWHMRHPTDRYDA